MNLLKKISAVLFNRYFLALAAFLVWMFFFDKNDFISQTEKSRELKELNDKIGYYQERIAETKQQVDALQNNPATLEQYAREKYYMKRANEDVFIVNEPTGRK